MLSAKQDLRVQGEIGQNKANMAPHRVFLSGMSPGCLLLFACGVVLITNTALCMEEQSPFLVRVVAGP
ncbi:hypothetical protein ACQRIU_007107 [Beauveria bassiana]